MGRSDTVCPRGKTAQSSGTLRARPAFGMRLYVAVAYLVLALLPCAWSQDPPAGKAVDEAGAATSRGRLILVPLPLTDAAERRVRQSVDRVLRELGRTDARPTLVFEFSNTAEQAATQTQFGRALDLARFLCSPALAQVRTIAYVPQSMRGHAVLVAMACEELCVAPDAEVGHAGVQETNIDATLQAGYREIADHRRTIAAAVALGMLDPSFVVYKVTTAAGVRFVLADELAQLQQEVAVQEVETLIPAGQTGSFTGERLRELGFVTHTVRDRRELAASLHMAAHELQSEPVSDGTWHPIRVELRGPVSANSVQWVQRAIEEQQRAGEVDFICLWLDSPGGSPVHSSQLAKFLASFDPSQVRTVAYITGEVLGDATLIAAACDQIVMQENAVLGGEGAYEISADEAALMTRAMRDFAREKSRRWSLFAATVDARLDVHRYQRRGTDVQEFFCEAELAEQPDADQWQRRESLTTPDSLFHVSAEKAKELGMIAASVPDLASLGQLYNLEHVPEMIDVSWAHRLITELSQPHVAASLLFLAMLALFFELSHPGVGLGGFVSALCFVLYFWSQYLHGTAGWLEVLLFLTGAICIAVEIFVLPGLGIFGIGGAGLILASLVLASQTFVIPRNSYQMRQVPTSLFIVLMASLGAMIGMATLRRYIQHVPLVRRMLLLPVEGQQQQELEQREMVADRRALLGRTGMTTTILSPAGKAQFGDVVIDVMSDGEAVARGTPVTVTHVAGNVVVIRPIESPLTSD